MKQTRHLVACGVALLLVATMAGAPKPCRAQDQEQDQETEPQSPFLFVEFLGGLSNYREEARSGTGWGAGGALGVRLAEAKDVRLYLRPEASYHLLTFDIAGIPEDFSSTFVSASLQLDAAAFGNWDLVPFLSVGGGWLHLDRGSLSETNEATLHVAVGAKFKITEGWYAAPALQIIRAGGNPDTLHLLFAGALGQEF